MGLNVNVYRNGGTDCTNGGASARANRLCLVNVPGPFEPTEDCPAAKLIMAEPIEGNKILRIIPLEVETRWTMFGGNYGASSDGRFAEKCKELLGFRFYGAVAIHDRVEG